jgi:hypothetical protein
MHNITLTKVWLRFLNRKRKPNREQIYPKLSEKSDSDPDTDPKKIIPDPQHCFYQCLQLVSFAANIFRNHFLGLQVAGYSSPLCGRSLHSLPAAVAVPPATARTTPLNIPLTVQTTASSSHSSSHLHHPPPLLTYPPPSSTELRVPTVASPAATLYPPYNLATSGVSLSIIQTNVICSGPRSLPTSSNPPPVMSSPHSISGSNSNSGGVIVVPHPNNTTANNSSSSSSNNSVVLGTVAPRGGCGPGCKCSGPLTRSRKRKLCTAVRGGGATAGGVGSGYPRPAEDSSQLAFDTGRGGGGGKCLRSGTITIE